MEEEEDRGRRRRRRRTERGGGGVSRGVWFPHSFLPPMFKCGIMWW